LSFLDLKPTSVSLTTGIELNYVRAGSGVPMIMIHGAMGDWRAWAPQWIAFSDQFDCISYSRRYSHPNTNELSTDTHSALVDAEDLEGLMDTLGLPSAILVGSSYGGFTALAMAARAPQRVKALVSVEAPMMRFNDIHPERKTVVDSFQTTSAEPANELFRQGDNEQAMRVLTGGIVGEAPSALPDHIMKRRMVNVRAARSLALSKDEFPMLERETLARLEMPIMLLSGKDTAPVHAVTFKSVSEAMPQAKTLIVEGAGHPVTQQQPEIFNREVLRFLAQSGLAYSKGATKKQAELT